MKKKVTVLLAVLIFALTSCTAKEFSFKGEFCDVSGKVSGAAFSRSYIMMDCCEEWDAFILTAKRIKGAGAVEGLEFYLYDKDGNVIQFSKPVRVTYHVYDEFKDKPYTDVAVCDIEGTLCWDVEVLSNGDVSFTTDHSGIFMVVKYSDDPLWISNLPDCNDECRTCSDDW